MVSIRKVLWVCMALGRCPLNLVAKHEERRPYVLSPDEDHLAALASI